MTLELHRRDEAPDTVVRLVKVFPRWLTANQYEEIPRQEAAVLSEALVAALPPATLAELSRLLAERVAQS